MKIKNNSNFTVGLLLIVVGIVWLALKLFPGLTYLVRYLDWPLYIFGVAGILILIGFLTGEPGLAVPACIVGGIGGILAWQNVTGNWSSWSYVWALIPGFVGVGVILAALLGPREKRWREVRDGLETIAVSAVLFLVFGAFFGQIFLGAYWPVLLILLGLISLGRAIFQRR